MEFAVVKFEDDERVKKVVYVSTIRESVSHKPLRPKAAEDFRTDENFYEVKWQRSDLAHDGYYACTILILAKTIQDAKAKAVERGIKLSCQPLLQLPSTGRHSPKDGGDKTRKTRSSANDAEHKKSLQPDMKGTSAKETPSEAKKSAFPSKSRKLVNKLDKKQSAAPSKPKANLAARNPIILDRMKLALDAARRNPVLLTDSVVKQAPQKSPIKDNQNIGGKLSNDKTAKKTPKIKTPKKTEKALTPQKTPKALTPQKTPKKDKPSPNETTFELNWSNDEEMIQSSPTTNSKCLKRKHDDDDNNPLSSSTPKKTKDFEHLVSSEPSPERPSQLSKLLDSAVPNLDAENSMHSDGEADRSDNASKSSGDFSNYDSEDDDDDVVVLSKRIDALKKKCKELKHKVKVQESTIKFCDSEMKAKDLANQKLQAKIKYLTMLLEKVHTITDAMDGKMPQSAGDSGVMSGDSGVMSAGGDAEKIKKNLFADMNSPAEKTAGFVTSTPKVTTITTSTTQPIGSGPKGKKKVPLIKHGAIEDVANALGKHKDKFTGNQSLPVDESGMFEVNNTTVNGKMLLLNVRKHHKSNLSLMTRNLTTLMWTPLERRGRSLEGKASNRFKQATPKLQATPQKVEAILGTVKFVLRDLQGMQETDAMESILKQQRSIVGNRLNQEDQKIKRNKKQDNNEEGEGDN